MVIINPTFNCKPKDFTVKAIKKEKTSDILLQNRYLTVISLF